MHSEEQVTFPLLNAYTGIEPETVEKGSQHLQTVPQYDYYVNPK